MFWKFGLLTSHIDTLLEKEDVTLLEVLDEEDVLQECKAQNRKLVDFLVRPDNIDELVNLITREPSDDTDEKNRYKYPNIACELLTSDVGQITDKLSGEDVLLAKVYGFLEAEGPLNPLLASFFSKVMGLLITRKSSMMLEFLHAKEDFVGHLLHHLGTSAIMDLVLRLITCIENTQDRINCISWLNDEKLIGKLVSMIDPSQADDKHCNASQSLCDIIRLSREQLTQQLEKTENDPLLTTLESQETVSSLLAHMFDGEIIDSVVVNGLAVIQTLLEYRKTGPDGSQEQMTSLDNNNDWLAQSITNTIAALTPRLKDFHQVLVDPPKQHYSAMPTSIGTLDPPLGNARLQVGRLLCSLLATNTHSVNVELANLGSIAVLLDLYFKYSWNNFLHTQVELCIMTILSNPPADGEDKAEHPLLDQLFNDVKILERILEGWDDNDQQESRPEGHRRGFMGHLTRTANHVLEFMEKGHNADRIKELVQDLPESMREKWETFVSSSLADINKKNTIELVRTHTLHSSSEDDDTDFRDIPFPQDTAMQQAFSDYQLQQMTSNFIDQFGFNEDEFTEQEERVEAPFQVKISSINFDISNSLEEHATEENPSVSASLFDQVCNERIQQYDDADSDEDLWEEKELAFSQGASSRLQSSNVTSQKDSDDDNSEGSTDSEEELDSPQTIFQSRPPGPQPPPVATKMEIGDSGQNWANFNDMNLESGAPVAMDTIPWENSLQGPTEASSSTGTGDWAKFDEASSSSTPAAGDAAPAAAEDGENWADFTSFQTMEANAEDSQTGTGESGSPRPRCSSPVAMETSEAAPSDRSAAYLAAGAPSDLAPEVAEAASSTDDQAASSSQSTSSQQSPSGAVPAESVGPASPSQEEEPSSTVSSDAPPLPSQPPPPVQTPSEGANSKAAEPAPAESTTESEEQPSVDTEPSPEPGSTTDTSTGEPSASGASSTQEVTSQEVEGPAETGPALGTVKMAWVEPQACQTAVIEAVGSDTESPAESPLQSPVEESPKQHDEDTHMDTVEHTDNVRHSQMDSKTVDNSQSMWAEPVSKQPKHDMDICTRAKDDQTPSELEKDSQTVAAEGHANSPGASAKLDTPVMMIPNDITVQSPGGTVTPMLEDIEGDEDEAEETDLSDNFNFLASSGLMSGGKSDEGDGQTDHSHNEAADQTDQPQQPTDKATEQSKIEEIRAQAKEALDEYSTAASSGITQNGPV